MGGEAAERAAIMLAESIKADLILLGEKTARRVAAERGLRVTGLLGVLGEACAVLGVDIETAWRCAATEHAMPVISRDTRFDFIGGLRRQAW